MLSWLFNLSTANAAQALRQLGGHYDKLFDQMTGKLGTAMAKWNIWEKMLDYVVNTTKQLINESRELIALSAKYDIPIQKMGQFQLMAQMAGQSLGQVARGFRFLEMNVSRALLKPGGPQYQAFHELGISMEQMEKGSRDTSYMMEILKSKIMAIGDEERRNYFLQQMYGANWQNMLPILEASKTELDDMADASYKYNESQTQSLATIEKNWAEIEQDVKPLAQFFAQIVAGGVTLLAMAIQGVKTLGTMLKDLVVFNIQTAVGGLQLLVGLLAKLTQNSPIIWAILKATGKYEQAEAFANETLKAGWDNTKTVRNIASDPIGTTGRYMNQFSADFRNMEALQDRFMVNVNGMISSVTGEDNVLVNQLLERINTLKREISNSVTTEKLYRDRLAQLKKEAATPENLKEQEEVQAAIIKMENQRIENQEELIERQKELDRAGYKPKKVDSGTRPRTAEEIKTEVDALKAQQGLDLRRTMALTPKVAEMESAMAVTKAYEEQLNIAKEINILIANNMWTQQTAAEYAKKAQEAEINLIEKQREHALFMKKQENARYEAERGRKESTIEMMQSREQTFMARQGMTGMDKQSVAVSHAIDKMVRDQEHLTRIMNDGTKTQAEREAAKKDVDASAIKAQQELDKLSLMQFQYGASDAAKKGMGGGIDIRENQLTVAKSQLDILKKQLDLMYKQYGLSPADYGGVPMMMQGAMRMK